MSERRSTRILDLSKITALPSCFVRLMWEPQTWADDPDRVVYGVPAGDYLGVG